MQVGNSQQNFGMALRIPNTDILKRAAGAAKDTGKFVTDYNKTVARHQFYPVDAVVKSKGRIDIVADGEVVKTMKETIGDRFKDLFSPSTIPTFWKKGANQAKKMAIREADDTAARMTADAFADASLRTKESFIDSISK